MSIQSGQTLSHYRLIEKIGQGGMGVVWRAEDTILGRSVAIKFLAAEATPDEERRQMFLKEARLASSVSDARIVQVFELGREGGLDFIVMELVEGKPLTDLLGGRGLPAEKVASIGEQVARALARAHQKQLLHRDIKPGNILVTADGDVKVVDFGLAALFQPSLSAVDTAISTVSRGAGALQGDGRIAGTLPYMSPEQVRGEKLDGRSDVFSLGTVLYEMTTGRRPFVAPTTAELAGEIQKARAKPVRDLRPDVPMDLDRIVQKSLAPKPADRYQTMQDLAVDLKRLGRDLESGSAPSYKELQSGSVRVPGKSRLARWVVAGVVVAVAVAAGAWTVVSRRAAAAARAHTILIMPFEVRGQADGGEYVGRAFAEQLAVNLAQSDGLKVFPVADEKELGASGALGRILAARTMGAGMIVTGALTREGNAASVDLSLTDVDQNRVVWGTRKALAVGQEDLSILAASLVQEFQGWLGVSSRMTYQMPEVPYGSAEFLASSELADMVGANRSKDRGRRLESVARLVQAFPREPYARLQRTLALWGEHERASPERRELESSLETLNELDPKSPWQDLFGGMLLGLDGEGSKAEALLNHGLAQNDLSPALRAWFLNNRGQVRIGTGQPAAAVADYREALALAPLNNGSVIRLGLAVLQTGHDHEGLSYLERALSAEPEGAWENLALGEAYERMGRLDDALSHYSKTCEAERKNRPDACGPFALVLARQGKFGVALPLLSAACEKDQHTCVRLALALELEGKAGEARAAAGRAEAVPETYRELYALAGYHALAGERAEAIRLLKQDVERGDIDIWIASDPDLKSLHGDPEFEAIVAEIKKRIAS